MPQCKPRARAPPPCPSQAARGGAPRSLGLDRRLREGRIAPQGALGGQPARSASVVLLVDPDLAAKLADWERVGVDLCIGLAATDGLQDLGKFTLKNALCIPLARCPHIDDIARPDHPCHCAL